MRLDKHEVRRREQISGKLSYMTPTQKMLLNYALAGLGGAFVGRSLAQKHPWQSAAIGGTLVMVLYGAVRENAFKNAGVPQNYTS